MTEIALTKEQKRAAKAARAESRQGRRRGQLPRTVNVGCVIHGRAYDWIYVERLYNMVQRHLPADLQFHVWTEHDRSVPPHMIKHCLTPWKNVSGPRKSWWYKMQMFDPKTHSGDLLYFDLDVVILRDLGWIVQELTEHFWILRDFRYLQNSRIQHNVNSSIMWWNTERWANIWQQFIEQQVDDVVKRFPGDQDFLNSVVPVNQRRLLPDHLVESWRWSAHDGGWDFTSRRARTPGTGTHPRKDTSVLVFHGRPKPHQIDDPFVKAHWQ